MATYKQKIPRVHHVPSDTEELSGSEQEWVMFNSSNQLERRLVNNVSDEEEWHVLSDTSPVEEVTPSFESNSEFTSGCSECDSEPYYVQDQTARSMELQPEGQDNFPFTRNMPSHDGTGNFFDTTLSDNESLSSNIKESVTDETSQDQKNCNNSIEESWITKLRNVFRIDVSAINSQEQTFQIYHKFAESISSAARFELGDLGYTNPIISYTNFDNENASSDTYTTVTTRSNVVNGSLDASIITRFGGKLIVPKDPMSINFAPTISKDMLNEMIATENVNSDHQNQQSSSTQSDSLLSMVWTAFCRIANNFILSDDTDSVQNDPSNLTLNHNTIITYKSHYSSSSTPPTPSSASSSTSLKSFTSRAGSDCGLESGRGIGESTNLGATLVH